MKVAELPFGTPIATSVGSQHIADINGKESTGSNGRTPGRAPMLSSVSWVGPINACQLKLLPSMRLKAKKTAPARAVSFNAK
jgi:hypothetical protein